MTWRTRPFRHPTRRRLSALALPAVACVLGAALSACNTVKARDESTVVIEHTSLRSREAVYDSALRVCNRQGKEQAVFQSQVNQDTAAKPATGPQLSTFLCR
ncbi:MAG: hypothetical protein V4505_17310 [Pseudomonadota bacterium]